METPGTNSVKVRKLNRKTILEVLQGSDSVSVADMARITGLSIATCANTLSEMADCGDALVLEEKKSRGGRPARRFAFNPDQFLVASLFLKVTNTPNTLGYFITNAYGEILDSGADDKSEITIVEIEACIERLSRQYPKLRSVAISIPGVVKNGVVDFCDIPALEGVHLEERIRNGFALEAVADNDTNFAAAGYLKTCGNTNVSGLAYIFFSGNGCTGAGIIVDGQLVHGRTNFAGELSFIPFDGSRKENDKRHSTPENFIQYIAKLSVAVTAVVDPDRIVLSGEAVTADMLGAVRSACLEYIPQKHLPEFVTRAEFDKDSLAGMVALAVNRYIPNAIENSIS